MLRYILILVTLGDSHAGDGWQRLALFEGKAGVQQIKCLICRSHRFAQAHFHWQWTAGVLRGSGDALAKAVPNLGKMQQKSYILTEVLYTRSQVREEMDPQPVLG